MDTESHKCPRYIWSPHRKPDDLSVWQKRDGFHHCSYCGSIHPDEFMEALANGAEIGTTDKNYKAYLHSREHGQTKFYYQHLSYEQKVEFVKLYNEKKLQYRGNYGFYVYPYFMAFKEPS